MVVTTIVLPLETEKNVEGDSEGVEVGLDGVIVVEVEEDVEVGDELEVDEVEDSIEVDDGRDVELSLEEETGGGVVDVDELTLGEDAEGGGGLLKYEEMLIFYDCC